MFWVRDNPDERYNRIRKFLATNEAPIAVLLSAANLEWTLRRAIIVLSGLSVEASHPILKNCHGPRGYRSAWKKAVVPHGNEDLSEIITNWRELVGEKGKAGRYQLRHDLIHGTVGNCGSTFAEPYVEAFLTAATDIDEYCKKRKKRSVYSKLPRRKNALS